MTSNAPPTAAPPNVRPPDPSRPNRPPDPDTPRPRHSTVILVDDDRATLDSTCMVLRELGYRPIPLEDPGEILEVVAREHPIAILHDLQIDGTNIAGIVAALRSDPASANVPLVFFSANPDIAHTASRYSAWGYLAKPFTPPQLAELLVRVACTAPDAPNPSARREARASFHEYWTALGALGSYAFLLRQREREEDPQEPLAQNIEDLVLKLQAQTQRLQGYVYSMIG